MLSNRFLTLVFAAGALLAAVPASADEKSFHGSFCGSSIWGVPVKDAVLGVGSDPSGRSVVSCPLYRDRLNSATSFNALVVEGFDGSTIPVECWLDSIDEDDVGGQTVDSRTKFSGAGGRFQMIFRDVLSSSGAEGSYGLTCSFYPGDVIYHYTLEEYETASD